jgi:hypothetical protein
VSSLPRPASYLMHSRFGSSSAPGVRAPAPIPTIPILQRNVSSDPEFACAAPPKGPHLVRVVRDPPTMNIPTFIDLSKLKKDQMISIGRLKQNHIMLDSLNEAYRLCISRVHAELTCREEGKFELMDRSRNGTYLNDVRVKTAVLASEDVITFGGPEPDGGPLDPVTNVRAWPPLPVGVEFKQPLSEFRYKFIPGDEKEEEVFGISSMKEMQERIVWLLGAMGGLVTLWRYGCESALDGARRAAV